MSNENIIDWLPMAINKIDYNGKCMYIRVGTYRYSYILRYGYITVSINDYQQLIAFNFIN